METERRGKKRKKSLLKNAKKYGKKGKYGKGSYLNEDTYNYFVRVLENLKSNSFETEEEKVLFSNNVFEETVDQEVNYSCNQLASAALDELLPTASDEVLKRFMNAFGQVLRTICHDPFGSHVLQKLLVITSKKGMVTGPHSPEESTNIFREWVLKVSQYVSNNLEDFVWDTYANHIIRTVVECLSGSSHGAVSSSGKKRIPTEDKSISKNTSESSQIPPSYSDLLTKFVLRLCEWPQFKDLLYSNLTSGLLQTVLFATNETNKKLTKTLISKLVNDCFLMIKTENKDGVSRDTSGNNTLHVFEEGASIHLLEAAIATAPKKSFKVIYENCFKNNLAKLAQHSLANFSVQKLLDHCKEKNEFEEMFDELSEHFEDILSSRKTGVLLSLAKACKTFSTRQGIYQQMLMRAFHCYHPKERQEQVAPLILCLRTHEEHNNSASDKMHINLHGSLIIQTMLGFNKPITVINSLLNMNIGDLKMIFSDPRGCHVMDAFMKSEYIGEKSRDKLIKKLQGSYVALACSKHGSRSLDAIWEVSNIKQKLSIMDELSSKEAILSSNQFGSILVSKYCVSLYRYRKEEWKDLQGKEFRKKKLFAEIIGDAKKSQ